MVILEWGSIRPLHTIIQTSSEMSLAIEHLLRANKRKLESLAFYLSKDEEAAKDIFQETVYRIWAKKESFQLGTNFSAWSRTIMCNYFRSLCNIAHRRQKLLAGVGTLDYLYGNKSRGGNPGEWLLFEAEVEVRLEKLSDIYRNPLVMLNEGYSYEETSKYLGVPLNTLKSRIHQGRKKLGKDLAEI